MTIRIPSEIFELKSLLEPTHDLPEWQPSGLVNNFPGAPAAPAEGGGQAGGEGGGTEPAGGAAQPGTGGGGGGGEGAAAAAQAADPRVLEQMQSQMEQFGGTIGQMAEYLPALQTLAQQQQQQAAGPPEPTLEELAAQFFGGEPVGQQQPETDVWGNPVQPQGQTQQQAPGGQMDPQSFAEAIRAAVRQEVSPIQGELQGYQQREQQREWDSLYEEIPALANAETARPYAVRVHQAAQLFGRSPEEAERLTQSAQFARFVYMSTVGEQTARGETPAGGELPNPIEGGGGTSPGGEQVDEGDRIVNAGGASGSYFG